MILASLIRITIGLILLPAFAAKIARLGGFLAALREYGIVPRRLQPVVAAVVPTIEGAIGICLISGTELRAANLAAACLFAMFGAVAAGMLARKRQLDCGCLGTAVRIRLGWETVGLNVLLAAGAIDAALHGGLALPFPSGAPHASASTSVVICLSSLLLAGTYWLIAYARSVRETIDEAILEQAEVAT